MTFGQALKKRRKELGLSLHGMAIKLGYARYGGMDPWYLSKLEGDKRKPNWSTVVRMAKALGTGWVMEALEGEINATIEEG